MAALKTLGQEDYLVGCKTSAVHISELQKHICTWLVVPSVAKRLNLQVG